MNLTNTPGIYYVIAYFLSSCLYIRMNPRRCNGVKLWGIQLLYLMLLGCFMVFTDNIDKAYFWPCMAVEFCLQWAVIYLCCRTDGKKALYFTIRAFILGEFAASLELQSHLEKDFLQSMLQLQYENYKISAESVELVNQKYHDLKHQIAFLRSEADSEEKKCLLRTDGTGD